MYISDQTDLDYYIIETSTMDTDFPSCSICLGDITHENKMVNPCCKQEFCSTCIYENISKGNTNCPLCRYENVIYDKNNHNNCEEIDDYIDFLENKIELIEYENKHLKKKNNNMLHTNIFYKSLLLINEIISLDDMDDMDDKDDIDDMDNIDDMDDIENENEDSEDSINGVD